MAIIIKTIKPTNKQLWLLYTIIVEGAGIAGVRVRWMIWMMSGITSYIRSCVMLWVGRLLPYNSHTTSLSPLPLTESLLLLLLLPQLSHTALSSSPHPGWGGGVRTSSVDQNKQTPGPHPAHHNKHGGHRPPHVTQASPHTLKLNHRKLTHFRISEIQI